ncbi:MAG: DUF975 family protein [Oscillospiraceae bacterium]|nr:DUF975 family protein [Oscillospiraceae bacterium]
MTQIRKQIKKNAKAALCGKWGMASAAVILIVCVIVLVSAIMEFLLIVFGVNIFNRDFMKLEDVLGGLVNSDPTALIIIAGCLVLDIILLVPLWTGLKRLCCNAAAGNETRFPDIFSIKWFSSIRLFFAVFIRFVLAAAVFSVPSAMLFLLPSRIGSGRMAGLVPLIYFTAFVLAVFALILGFVFIKRYFLSMYLASENPDWKLRRCLKVSAKMMRGRKSGLLNLELSFIPLLLTGVLVVPLIFIIPYIQTSFAIYAKYIIQDYENSETEKQLYER